MKKINSHADLNFLKVADLTDAFIRECYLVNPSYISDEFHTIIAPNSLPTIKILICTPDANFAGLS